MIIPNEVMRFSDFAIVTPLIRQAPPTSIATAEVAVTHVAIEEKKVACARMQSSRFGSLPVVELVNSANVFVAAGSGLEPLSAMRTQRSFKLKIGGAMANARDCI
jgi:hypothetical protein